MVAYPADGTCTLNDDDDVPIIGHVSGATVPCYAFVLPWQR